MLIAVDKIDTDYRGIGAEYFGSYFMNPSFKKNAVPTYGLDPEPERLYRRKKMTPFSSVLVFWGGFSENKIPSA